MTVSYGNASSSFSILERVPNDLPASALSSAQIQLDAAISGFADQASDVSSLGAMMAGSLAFGFTRLGILASPLQKFRSVITPLASVTGLGAEVLTFRTAHHGLQRLTGGPASEEAILDSRGILRDFVQFGTLKTFAPLVAGRNPILAHAIQSSSLVAANNITSSLGLTPQIEGSLIEQFAHAELTNLQMQAGMSLAAYLSGHRVSILERANHIQLEAFQSNSHRAGITQTLTDIFIPQFQPLSESPTSSFDLSNKIMMMTGPKGSRRSSARRGGVFPHPPSGKLITDEVISLALQEIPSRESVRASIEACVAPLSEEALKLEKARLGIVQMLGEEPQSHPEYVRWMEIYDSIITRQSEVTRKYNMDLTVLEPKGGAETWDISRLIKLEGSLLRAVGKAREFYDGLSSLKIPQVETSEVQVREIGFNELRRLYSRLSLPEHFQERLFHFVKMGSVNDFVLSGLEGLHRLLDRAAGDEKASLISFINRVADSQNSDSASFLELMILTMNYQLGLLSRDSVMQSVSRSNLFHETYPRARGPFLELFSKMQLVSSEANNWMHVSLNFARHHLEQGAEVLLENHGSVGMSVLRVRDSAGAECRYGVGVISEDVIRSELFNFEADRIFQAIVEVEKRDVEHSIPGRLYIAMPRLAKQITPPVLRSWGENYLAQHAERVLQQLTEQDYGRAMKGQFPGGNYIIVGRSVEVIPASEEFPLRNMTVQERDLLQKSIRAYWEQRLSKVEQVEMAYYARPRDESGRAIQRDERERRERGINHVEVVNASSISREVHIADLQSRVAEGRAEAADVVLLAQLLEGAGRGEESIALLRNSLVIFPKVKLIINQFRERYLERLERVFNRGDRSLFDPEVAELFSDFFARRITVDDLQQAFVLPHPTYEIADVTASRYGGALRIHLNIKSHLEEEVARVAFEISLPERERHWSSHLYTFRTEAEHQGKGIGMFGVDRAFAFLRQIGVFKMTLTTDEVGPYTWLRMGAEFSQPHQAQLMRVIFGTFLESEWGEGTKGTLPYPRIETNTDEEFAENMHFIKQRDPDKFGQFINSAPDIHYEFNLGDNSNSYQRFRRYFERRSGRLLAVYPPH